MAQSPVRDPGRVLAALAELVEAMEPHDLRVGQAIVNALLLELGPGTELARLFHVEDDRLAQVLDEYAARLRAQR